MPAAIKTAGRTEKEEQLFLALKRQILRERKKKKEEQEAEVEEERLRREREAREKQDEMTLGETRDQIQIFETKLEELRNDKKQLFLQLKKVLNEDDIRKRQLRKESSEMFALHGMQTQHPLPPIIFNPRTQQLLQKNSGPGQNQSLKRSRSPSPPQGYYKPGSSQSYSQPPKHEESGRRGGEPNRAVLWNKPSQYANSPGTLFYPNAPTNSPDSRSHPIIFPNYANLNIPLRQNYHDLSQPTTTPTNQTQMKNENKIQSQTQNNVYHINLDPPTNQQPQQNLSQKAIVQNQITLEKMSERSNYLEERKDSRSQQPLPGQNIQEVYNSSMRHIHPLQQQQQATKPTQVGYSSRPTGQQQQQQVQYPRHRY